ncbi:MAG: hypothetical protein JWO38_6879 [Gemmataceae bacterium]|nr:hypothetical protein [Gemmataceae bacterium]
MSATLDSAAVAHLPPELVRSVADDGVLDAHRVGTFLQALGLTPPPGRTYRIPLDVLLNLGAALRLVLWEEAGLTVHREAGLPAAGDALQTVFFDAVPEPGETRAPDPWLFLAVFRLTVDRFAWSAPSLLAAEVLLDVPDEETLVEAMAHLLWTARHPTPSGTRGPTR